MRSSPNRRAVPTRAPTRQPGSSGNRCRRHLKSSNLSRRTTSSADAEPNSARWAFTPESTPRLWIVRSFPELSVGFGGGRVSPLHNIHSLFPRPENDFGPEIRPEESTPPLGGEAFRRTLAL